MSVLDRLDALDDQVRAKPWPIVSASLVVGLIVGLILGAL